MPGNDIDTDRIIPARFLKEVTFETMGEHAFEDARKQNPEHPFNQKAYQGASVLVVGPELRLRLLAGACAAGFDALGHPRHRRRVVWRDLLRQLRDAGDSVPASPRRRISSGCRRRSSGAPQSPVTVDVEKQEVSFGDRTIKATVPDGPRNQLVGGTWDSTAVLLEAGAAIEATAGKLPYVKGF